MAALFPQIPPDPCQRKERNTAMVHLLCGKICSGKTTYAKLLAKEHPAVILSCDEVALTLFGSDLGQRHDEVLAKVRCYLLKKAAETARAGADVILDWGFWSEQDRRETTAYFENAKVPVRWHYISVSEEVWQRNIERRNAAVTAGRSTDYYVDAGLLSKLNARFEPPRREDMDCWHDAK